MQILDLPLVLARPLQLDCCPFLGTIDRPLQRQNGARDFIPNRPWWWTGLFPDLKQARCAGGGGPMRKRQLCPWPRPRPCGDRACYGVSVMFGGLQLYHGFLSETETESVGIVLVIPIQALTLLCACFTGTMISSVRRTRRKHHHPPKGLDAPLQVTKVSPLRGPDLIVPLFCVVFSVVWVITLSISLRRSVIFVKNTYAII